MMAVQLSPGVAIEEKDFSVTVAGQSTSIGGFAGVFTKGPMNKIINISSSAELEQIFGRPNVTNRGDFYLAKQFLQGSNSLRVVRVATLGDPENNVAGTLNATSGSAGILVKNRDDYFNTSFGATIGNWVAKSGGAWANGIIVSICPASSTAFNAWIGYNGNFPTAPATSAYAQSRGRTLDEMHIIVIDGKGLISGTPNKILERYAYLSQASDAIGSDGQGIYYKDVINNQSQYIYFANHATTLTSAGQATTAGTGAYVTGTAVITDILTNGVQQDDALPSQYNAAYDLFRTDDNFGVDILFSPNLPSSVDDARTISNNLISIAESTKKCFAVLGMPTSITVGKSDQDQIDAILAYVGAEGGNGIITRSSYACINPTPVQVYDGFNNGGSYIWIPSSANDALCIARSLVSASPAGTSKGIYLNVGKIGYNPSKARQDTLFQRGINYAVQDALGVYLSADKTFTARSSTFDQIGVRRAFIYLQKVFGDFAKNFLFEFNDQTTRNLVRIRSEQELKRMVTNKIIEDYIVDNPTSPSATELSVNYKIQPLNSVRFINIGLYNVGTNLEVNVVEA